MLADPRFARVAYALFGVAVLAALLKLGGISGAQLLALRTVPSTPVAKAEEAAAAGERVSVGERLDLPDEERSLTRTSNPPARLKAQNDAPVFYRPSPGSTREANGSSEEPACGDLGDFPKSSRAVFPLPDAYFDSYEDTWGAPRPQGGHEGTDLMSPAGIPEFAITDGTIVPVSGTNKNGWNRLGGYTVMLEAAYDIGPIEKGDLFYYAHMDRKSALPIGTKVRAGQQIGVVGNTGEGPEVTQSEFPPHLHLGWYDTSSASDRTNLRSGAMNPYPLLLWLEENGGAVTGGTAAAYCKAPQEPIPALPGASPDLDTGDAYDARPSPVIGESRDHHDHSSERENGSGNGPDEKDHSGKLGGWIGATGEDPRPGSTDRSEREDRAGDDPGETSAPADGGPAASGARTSRSSVEDDSPGVKIREKGRTFLPHPRSGHTMRRYYASILAYALRKADEIRKPEIPEDRDDEKNTTKKDRDDKKHDGGNADTPDKEKQKKSSNPLERGEPEKDRSASETGAAQPRPVPDEKGADNTPGSEEDPETRSSF